MQRADCSTAPSARCAAPPCFGRARPCPVARTSAQFNVNPKRGLAFVEAQGLLDPIPLAPSTDEEIVSCTADDVDADMQRLTRAQLARQLARSEEKQDPVAIRATWDRNRRVAHWLHALMFRGLNREAVGSFLGDDANKGVLRAYLRVVRAAAWPGGLGAGM
jgi:hypothetical protein